VSITFCSSIKNTELAKAAPDRLYLYVVFSVQLSCHTGSHGFLDRSDRAIVDCYSFHGPNSLIDSDTQLTQSCQAKSSRYVRSMSAIGFFPHSPNELDDQLREAYRSLNDITRNLASAQMFLK